MQNQNNEQQQNPSQTNDTETRVNDLKEALTQPHVKGEKPECKKHNFRNRRFNQQQQQRRGY